MGGRRTEGERQEEIQEEGRTEGWKQGRGTEALFLVPGPLFFQRHGSRKSQQWWGDDSQQKAHVLIDNWWSRSDRPDAAVLVCAGASRARNPGTRRRSPRRSEERGHGAASESETKLSTDCIISSTTLSWR